MLFAGMPSDRALVRRILILIVLGDIAKALLGKQALGFVTRGLGLGCRNDNLCVADIVAVDLLRVDKYIPV
jgi:hypothetical protein